MGLVACVALAACGDDADDTDASADTTAAPSDTTRAEELTKEPIVIGMLVEQSGPVAGRQADVPPAASAWADWVNTTQGGINGHPVELKILDTTDDPATAQSAAQSLIDDPSVVLISLTASSVEPVVGKMLSDSGLAIVGQGYNPVPWGADLRANGTVVPALPNVFTTSATITSVIDIEAVAAKDSGLTKMAVGSCSEDPTCDQTGPLFEAQAAATGIDYAGLFKLGAAAPNYTAECVKLISEGVDYFHLSIHSDTVVRVVEDCLAQGYEGWFGAAAVSAGDHMSDLGAKWTGGINGFPWWSDDPAVAEFRDVMEDAGVDYGTPAVTGTWANLELFRKYMADASDDVTRAEVLAALNSVTDEDLGGLFAQPLTFEAGTTAPSVHCTWTYLLEGGKFSSPDDSLESTCLSASEPTS